MENLLFIFGLIPLANCAYALFTGRLIYFFKAPTEFIGSFRAIEREKTPVVYWLFFAMTFAFGTFIIYFAGTNF